MFLRKMFDIEYILAILAELAKESQPIFGHRLAIVSEVANFEDTYGRSLPMKSFYKSIAMDICTQMFPEAVLLDAE